MIFLILPFRLQNPTYLLSDLSQHLLIPILPLLPSNLPSPQTDGSFQNIYLLIIFQRIPAAFRAKINILKIPVLPFSIHFVSYYLVMSQFLPLNFQFLPCSVLSQGFLHVVPST